MPGAADFIQRAVHAMEAGGLAIWIRRGLVLVVIFALAFYYMWPGHLRGLATSQAMDQAQIARHIASGHGWATSFARPLAIGQLQAHKKNVATQIWVDTYNAPLPPLVNAIALLLVKPNWKMANTDLIYSGDKAIALTAIMFFLLSVVVLFFIARRLFDQRLALLGCAMVLLSDVIWQYSISGLPQMLLLFLFNVLLYVLIRTVQAKYTGTPLIGWLAAAGVCFGLLALSHALTIWMFAAFLIFSLFFFPSRLLSAGVLLGAFLIIYSPWLIRTWVVCGNPGGMAVYSFFDQIGRSEAGWMRQLALETKDMGFGAFRSKFSDNLVTQFNHMFEYLGWNVVAFAFFWSLLHRFKRPETAALRWMILIMWAGAVVGMTVFGVKDEQGFAANQLHLIFVPIMVCYGFAFLLVLWNRLEVTFPFSRAAFITGLFLICTFPMLNTMVLSGRKPLIMWPPYVPPYIAVLRSWMQPQEITASDMPWAIAWYADRKAVWLPDTVKNFIDMNDYQTLGGPLSAIYLTPISGTNNKWGDILKGEYKDWGGIIQHTAPLDKFILKHATLALGVNEECVFVSDVDRTKIKVQQ